MDKIPDQIGYLVLTEEGAVIESGGDLENDERVANIIIGLVSLSSRIDRVAFPSNELFKKISVTYDDHCFIICLSNKKIHIVKKMIRHITPEQGDTNTVTA